MNKTLLIKNVIKKLSTNKEYSFKYIRNCIADYNIDASISRVILHRLHKQGIITIVNKGTFIKEDDKFEVNLFVYGSLKRGFLNDMIMSDAVYVCKAVTVRKFAMYKSKNGDYPYLIKNKPICNIKGELYRVKRKDVLFHIDEFEGSPSYYTREAINIQTRSGRQRAYTYFYMNQKEHKNQQAIEEWTKPELFDVDAYYKSLLKDINED